MNCDAIRDELALNPTTEKPGIQSHLAQCPACENYRRSHARLDAVLRTELRWQAPAALTASLLAIAATAPLTAPALFAPVPRPQPKGWYVTLVYVLTALAIAVSLMVAWQFVGGMLAQVGVADAWAWLWVAPSRGMQALVQALPESRTALALFLGVRDKLLWLLLVAVLWAALDKWSPTASIGQQQHAS